MSKITDVTTIDSSLYFLPVQTRVPLKFGAEILTHITCARVCIKVKGEDGKISEGWGETPLSVQWVWPSSLPYEERHTAIKDFSVIIAKEWKKFTKKGHPMEIGHAFQETALVKLFKEFNDKRKDEPMPWLAALVCCSAFDIALHDAYGILHNKPIYETYNSEYMNEDLSYYLTPAEDTKVDFKGKYPSDFLTANRLNKMPAWHLVGGKDLLDESELTGNEPKDGYPVLLREWIRRDGLTCLKVKLTGSDIEWDYKRLVDVGNISIEENVLWLTTDLNCLVTDPAYVNEILDRLLVEHPRIYSMILYVEQPFPYELEENQIDVHSVSARKPLFMDESAHDWHLVKLGRKLGWTGVALKTCKTQTGALLTLCWAKAHGMTLMVQDLTNPMIAQIPHVLLAAHGETIMGVETNSMQFYPDASLVEAKEHPGIYKRRNGEVDLQTITGAGFGYNIEKFNRELPKAVVELD